MNTYSFFALYANVDGFDGSEQLVPVHERQEIDRWILSELNSLVQSYCQSVDGYDITRAARAVSDFTIDQLSNWYVRRNRRRFWKSEKGKDKTSAYQTLYECLLTLSKLIAPFAPFIAEEMYRNLTKGNKATLESVHLESLPVVHEAIMNTELEHRMMRAITIVGMVRAMRMKSNLKVRQPLQKIMLPVKNETEKAEIELMKDVILEEINVKQMDFVGDESAIIKKKAKPNFKTLGPKYGKVVQHLADRVKELNAREISTLEKEGKLLLTIDSGVYEIETNDVEILHEDIQGWLVETDGVITVALDTVLTDGLIDEGLAREFVNRVQNLRKNSGFEVTDRIKVYYISSQRLTKALQRMADYIKQETLALELITKTKSELEQLGSTEEDINGEPATIAVERI